MRNIDGLQPQEAFDELLKYLYFKQNFEIHEILLEKSLPSILEVKKIFNQFLNIKENCSNGDKISIIVLSIIFFYLGL